MDVSLGLGLFLLGAGVGALVTAIAYAGQIRDLRAKVEAITRQDDHEDAA